MSFTKIIAASWKNIRAQHRLVAATLTGFPPTLNRRRRIVPFAAVAFGLAALIPFTGHAQTALTNGWANAGAISAAGETDPWTIAANPGDNFAVQVSKLSGGAGFTPRIEIFSPDGASLGIKSGGFASRLDIQANVSGTYTVVVGDANGTGTGNYALQLAQVPGAFTVMSGDQGGSLTNGAIHPGTIDLGDSMDLWTVPATAGDRITLQIAKTAGGAAFTPMIELFAPDGARLGVDSGGTAARLDVQAGVSGTYTVLVSDANQSANQNIAGDYQLQLAQVPGSFVVPAGDEGGPLTTGADIDGAILLGDLDQWTITANPGDHLTLQATELTGGVGFTPMIELFSPNGERKAVAQNAAAATIDVAIEVGGTYTVLVSDANQTGAGTYRLHLTRGVIAPPGASVLTNGGTSLGSILSTGQTNTYTFTASAGESIVVRMGETVTAGLIPWLRLYGPTGVQLDNNLHYGAAAAEITVRATNSGTYLVVVADGSAGRNQIGDYRISLVKTGSPVVISANDEGGPLTNGATHLATINTGDIDAWTFTANAGESIVVRMGETTANSTLVPWLRLYGPDGVQLDNNLHYGAAAAEVAVRATNSGTFTVVAADGTSGWTGVGDYRLSLAKTGSALEISPSDEGGPLTNGATHLATINTGDIDAWTFTANAGERIVVRMGETTANSTLVPWLRLYGPDGVQLDNNLQYGTAAAEVTVRATNSGTFTVVAADGTSGWTGVGDYRLSLIKTGNALEISPSDEGGPLINGATHLATINTGDIDAWTFTANAGESIVVRMGETTANSTLVPWLRLYGPDGVQLDNNLHYGTAAAEIAVRATNSGTFTVVAADGTSGWTGVGDYRLSLAKTGSPLSISDNDEGGALTNGLMYLATITTGDIDAWTFTANAGESIVVRMGEVAGNNPLATPWLRLYGPDGVQLDNNLHYSTAAVEIAVRATNSGTFMVVAADGTSGFGGTGDYRISLAKAGSPFFVSPGDEGGPMTGAGVYDGTIDIGDIDAWTFTVCAGDNISLSVAELVPNSGLYPWVRLYGWNGAPLKDLSGPASVLITNLIAPASGTYTVVLSDGNNGLAGTGTYRLTVNGLIDEFKLCLPNVAGTNVNVIGIGGVADATSVLLSTTNVATPLNQWIPVVTNQFDHFGVFNFLDAYSTNDPPRFFILEIP